MTSRITTEREARIKSEDNSGQNETVGRGGFPADREVVEHVRQERTPYNTALPDPPTPPYPSALFCWDPQLGWVQESDESDGFWSDGPPNTTTTPTGVRLSLAEAAKQKEEVSHEPVCRREEDADEVIAQLRRQLEASTLSVRPEKMNNPNLTEGTPATDTPVAPRGSSQSLTPRQARVALRRPFDRDRLQQPVSSEEQPADTDNEFGLELETTSSDTPVSASPPPTGGGVVCPDAESTETSREQQWSPGGVTGDPTPEEDRVATEATSSSSSSTSDDDP